MVIISASLILPFLLRVLGGGEGFESESAFLFNSNSYSLQKSSAIQQISVKQSSFWAFVETILRQKQVLLIPNWGYYTNFIAFMEDPQRMSVQFGLKELNLHPRNHHYSIRGLAF